MKIHIVKQGETLDQLSEKYQVVLKKLIETNPQLDSSNEIDVGMKVKIPMIETKVTFSRAEDSTKAKETVKPVNTAKKQAEAMMPNQSTEKPVETVMPAQQPKKSNIAGDSAYFNESAKSEDLFAQFKVPAEKVGSFYDIPEIADMQESPWGNSKPATSNQPAFLQPFAMEPPQSHPCPAGCMQPGYSPNPLANEFAQSSYDPQYGGMPTHTFPHIIPNQMYPYGMQAQVPEYGFPIQTIPYNIPNHPSPYSTDGSVPCDIPVYPGINNPFHHLGQSSFPKWNSLENEDAAESNAPYESTSQQLNSSEKKSERNEVRRIKQISKIKRKPRKTTQEPFRIKENLPWINR